RATGLLEGLLEGHGPARGPLACSRALRLTLASCPPAPRAKESSRKGSGLHPALLEGHGAARGPLGVWRALRLTLASCPPAPRAKESSRKGSGLHPALLEGLLEGHGPARAVCAESSSSGAGAPESPSGKVSSSPLPEEDGAPAFGSWREA